jgi:hypothetical protein
MLDPWGLVMLANAGYVKSCALVPIQSTLGAHKAI